MGTNTMKFVAFFILINPLFVSADCGADKHIFLSRRSIDPLLSTRAFEDINYLQSSTSTLQKRKGTDTPPPRRLAQVPRLNLSFLQRGPSQDVTLHRPQVDHGQTQARALAELQRVRAMNAELRRIASQSSPPGPSRSGSPQPGSPRSGSSPTGLPAQQPPLHQRRALEEWDPSLSNLHKRKKTESPPSSSSASGSQDRPSVGPDIQAAFPRGPPSLSEMLETLYPSGRRRENVSSEAGQQPGVNGQAQSVRPRQQRAPEMQTMPNIPFAPLPPGSPSTTPPRSPTPHLPRSPPPPLVSPSPPHFPASGTSNSATRGSSSPSSPRNHH